MAEKNKNTSNNKTNAKTGGANNAGQTSVQKKSYNLPGEDRGYNYEEC